MALTTRPQPPAALPDTGTDFDVPEQPAKKARVPFGSMTQKLAYPHREGYHRHWFNDEPGRIERALAAGYDHVLENGEKLKKVVGRYEGGVPIVGYLMEVPQEWYDADMAAEEQIVKDKEDTIRRGRLQGAVAKDDSGRYYDTAQGRSISIKRGA